MRCRLAIHDLATGGAETVLVSDRLIEAPNWHPDGYLIVNCDGRLWRVPLDRPDLRPIDTGHATACNNDHGLSPDGRTLAISDRSRTDGSCIYTVPVGGGTPVRVTEGVPSYWHGWSPDGARLAYVARRDGAFDIHTIAVDGGAETRLTRGFDHTDGPDYTPDGAWIWFNGQRDGSMDLWRVPAGGGAPERMTRGDSVDWFPHPSPDGAHVLYLAYPPGTEGHPRERPVELRLMPAEGGAGRSLRAVFGGQGTINVPCWAPDSARFAFVELVD